MVPPRCFLIAIVVVRVVLVDDVVPFERKHREDSSTFSPSSSSRPPSPIRLPFFPSVKLFLRRRRENSSAAPTLWSCYYSAPPQPYYAEEREKESRLDED